MTEPPCPRRRIEWSVTAIVLAVAAAAFLIGIRWGLPSRAADPYLFGQQEPWSGQKIVGLAPAESDERGADVDANPILGRESPVVLNPTDEQRAEIVRRYRLFSYQPDEMITFKSLSRLRANRGDPRLYQYGGLWIYPVGAIIAATLDPKSDQAHYLDHPEEFAKFYIAARAYSALWGLIATWTVMCIVRRLTASLLLSAGAGLAFAFMPVVVTMAHEAKPHLAGTALILLTVAAAMRFNETNARRHAWLACAFAGAAFAMVLTGIVAFAVIIVMAWKRWTLLAQGIALGLAVYALTNPFVLINALFHRELLLSNLGNTSAMYAFSFDGVINAIWLIAAGASPLIAIAGIAALIIRGLGILPEDLRSAASRRAAAPLERSGETPKPRLGLLLAPALLAAIQFILLASGKPPEYARFGLLIDATLVIAAFVAIVRMRSAKAQAAVVVLLVLFTAIHGFVYVRAFVRDSAPLTSRLAAAEKLEGRDVIRVKAEPAPYVMPPVNLFETQLILDPSSPDVRIAPSPAPISWADVRFEVSSP